MCGIRLLTGLRGISDYRNRTLTCAWENSALSSVWTVPRAGTRNTYGPAWGISNDVG